MEQAVPQGIGAMAAVLGMTAGQVETVVTECNSDQLCVANYNCPGQVVISGEKNEVLKAMDALKAAGAKRVVELNCSGPFHSPMLVKAGEQLGEALESVEFNKLNAPYVANLTAEYVNDEASIKELLTKQVYSSVRFEQSVRMLIEDGVDTFIEIGPGKTLTGFVKKLSRDVKLINVEKVEDLEKLAEI